MEDVIITNLILCIICSTHEGMVSYGIYLFKIEQTYILYLYKRVAVCWKCNCQWTWKYFYIYFSWYSNSKWIQFYWKYFVLFSFVYLLEGHNCVWFWSYSVHHAGICKTVPLGIINKIYFSRDLIYIYIYILSVYSPFSDRVGLPLHYIHIASPFRLYNIIYFIMWHDANHTYL